MSTFLHEPETLAMADQHAFNLAVWEKVVGDEFLAGLPHRTRVD